MTPLIGLLVGYFSTDEVELAGAVVLTAGMWTVAWLVSRDVRQEAPTRAVQVLFVSTDVSAGFGELPGVDVVLVAIPRRRRARRKT